MSVSLPAEGGCMCGEVRLKVSAPPIMTMACHCTGCQKLSASAFSLTAIIPSEGFEVLQGKPQIGALHGASQYFYCPNCLNWLFTRPVGMDAYVSIRPTMFGVAAWSTPFMETFVAEKLPWAWTSAKHSYPGFAPPGDYGRLMQEFAAQAHA